MIRRDKAEMSQVCKYTTSNGNPFSAWRRGHAHYECKTQRHVFVRIIGLWVIRRPVWTQLFGARRAILMNIDVPRHTVCSTRGQCISIINTSGHRIACPTKEKIRPWFRGVSFSSHHAADPTHSFFYFLHTSRLDKLDITNILNNSLQTISSYSKKN